MLGDELKKSLEPIQASDELLEKTRRAIEQARLQQASATLAQKSAPKKNTAYRSMFLRAVVPIACVLILGFGILAILPAISKKTDSEKGGVKSPLKEHNDAINTVEKDIDSIIGKQNTGVAMDTNADSEDNRSYETTTQAASESAEWCEETTIDLEDDKNKYLTPSVRDGAADIDQDEISSSVKDGDYVLCISEDKKSLVLKDARTDLELANDGSHAVPRLRLASNETIIGLFYVEDTNSLFITTEEAKVKMDGTPDNAYHVYYCIFKDGKVVGQQPVRIGD